MTVKEYLLQVRRLDATIQRLDQELKRAKAELIALRSSWPDGQPHGSGGTSDPVGEKASQLADTITQIEHDQLMTRARLWKIRAEIVETVGEVLDPFLQEILYSYYVDGKTFEQVAVDTGYSYRHVTRKHGEALVSLSRILEKKKRCP